ncbi:MAG: leucine-rich repeat protein [Eubacterium sp.]
MKKTLSIMLSIVMIVSTLFAVPFSAQAEVKYPEASGTLLSGQTFTYDASTETLTISGEGAITGYYWTGENASPFENCTVKHIVIEEGITSLCNYIFDTVSGIETFSIPASLTTIQIYAIDHCTFVGGAGNGFTVADGSESFCAYNGTLYNKDKTRLIRFVNSDATEFTVPDTVSSIAFEAFSSDVTLDKLVLNGTNLVLDDYAIRVAKIKHLEINEGVKFLGNLCSIDSTVWEDETITLPASLEAIGTQGFFDGGSAIKNFVVAEGNTVFSAIDGVLYKDGTTLFSYPAGRTDTSFTVSDSTTTIGNCAFSFCKNLESVDFPASVKTFSSRSLKCCSNVTTVNIRALDAEFLDTDSFFDMNGSVVYKVYENSATHKNMISKGIEESKIDFLPLCDDHSYELTKTVEPTCYSKGYELYTCSVCNATEKHNETNMVDHETVTTYNEDKTVEHHLCKNHSFIIEETENLPESEHNYQSNTNQYFELSYPGADTISITFDEQFKTESATYDYLKAYDKNGNEIAVYSGTDPAGQTYTLNGDYVKLHFHSDGSNEYYGFKITKVVAEKVGCDYSEPDTAHTHNYGEYAYNDDATCTENGTETATCVCGHTIDRAKENSALGHDWEAATCLAPKTCKRCGATEGGLGEHSYYIASQCPATCGADGVVYYACTRCSATKEEAITERSNHQLNDSYDSETNSVITTCANKDGFAVEYTEDLPESAHEYGNNISEEYALYYPGANSIEIYFNSSTLVENNYDYIYIYKDSASGEQIGKYTGTALQGKTITVDSSKAVIKLTSDHSTTRWGFKVDKVVATYPGCGYETSASHSTHNVESYTSDNNATCTEDGTKTGTCTICSKPVTVQDEGSKLGHDLVEVAEAVNPTCFSVGWTAGYKCSRCDYEQRQEEIAMIAHTVDDSSSVSNNDSTCTADGTKTGTCTVCSKPVTVTDEGSALGHGYVPAVVPATCTTQGYTVYTCSRCGDCYSGNYINPSGHNFGTNNQTCLACGIANPNYVAPTPTPTPAPTTPAMPKSVKNGGVTYTKNSAGEYVGKKAKKSSVKKLTKGKKAFTVTYTKVSGVTGYEVQYSTSKKFTKKTTKKATFKGNKKFTKTVKKLSGNKKYYVRVRTYKTVKVNGKSVKLYSSWSSAKTVTTKK